MTVRKPLVRIDGGVQQLPAGDVLPQDAIESLVADLAGKVADDDARLTDAREWTADTVTEAEAEAGTATTRRAWTAQRVRQAIVAWWNSASSAWGRGFVSSADAAAGRTALGLGSVDNTSDADKPISTATATALNSKQPTLVSGANIKTVNGNSLLGSGDLEVTGGGGGAPLFSVQWWPQRSAIPAGYVAADGQTLSRATYPEAWAGIVAGNVPTVAEATWQSTNTERGKYTLGDGSTTFRLPDYNGKSAGARGAVFLRGDGALSAGAAGAIQQDALQNITGSIDPVGRFDGLGFNVLATGAFSASAGSRTEATSGTVVAGKVTLDISAVARTATETRPLNVTGCWVIKLFGAVVNVGSADAAQLASDYANLVVRVSALESSGGPFTKEYVSAEQTITTGGLLNLSHNLGVKPKHVALFLKCVTADQGYSAGQETEIGWGPQDSGASWGANYTATSSVISVRIGTTGEGFLIINMSNGTATDMTSTARWRIIVRAWA